MNYIIRMDSLGLGGGQVVSVLAFYSDDPSSNPAEVYNFSVKLLLKRMKKKKQRPGLAHFKKRMDSFQAETYSYFIQLL